MTRRSLREDGHYEGVPTELTIMEWRRRDYIKSIDHLTG
jgi:hypothetical protein